MDQGEETAAVYRGIAFGAAVVVAFVVAVRAALPEFPSTSPASMAFFAALAFVAVANVLAALAQVLVRVPARVPVTRWMFALLISRLSFAWAMFLLVTVAVIGSIVDQQLAGPLFRTLIVEMMLAAFWFMTTSTIAIVAVIWSRTR